jgi:iron(III) transport system permease protein
MPLSGSHVPRPAALLATPLPLAVALLVALPLLGLAWTAVAGLATGGLAGLSDLALGDYAGTSARLAMLVWVGTVSLGTLTGWITASFEFPGRRALSWLLVLPLAVPAYVIAYAYADLLQFSGPVQTGLRESFGWRPREYWFPEIRSLGGAAAVFSLVLFPYVHLPARAAFESMPRSLVEAATLSGVTGGTLLRRVVVPMAWPAIAGGSLLCVMETLADYGAVSHFAVDTFSVGIYKAWLGYGDRVAAVQLAMVLLLAVLVLLGLDAMLRGRRVFTARRSGGATRQPVALRGGRALACALACLLPVLLGFVLPVLVLGRLAWNEFDPEALPRYLRAARASFLTAGASALVVMAVALLLVYAARARRQRWSAPLHRVASLGYAVPGAVLALGILVPVARFDNWLDAWSREAFGTGTGLILTGSVGALVYAYVVRFLAIGIGNLQAGFDRVTPHMDEAARSLGAGGADLLRRVHLPLVWRVLALGGLLVFVDGLKELPATLALRPFNFDTLATQAYHLAKDERLAEAAVPSLVIVLIAVLPVILVTRVASRR